MDGMKRAHKSEVEVQFLINPSAACWKIVFPVIPAFEDVGFLDILIFPVSPSQAGIQAWGAGGPSLKFPWSMDEIH